MAIRTSKAPKPDYKLGKIPLREQSLSLLAQIARQTMDCGSKDTC